MFPVLLSFFGWASNNIKWIAIGLLVVVVAFGAWRYTRLVENYATAKQTIAQLELNIKEKEKALQTERDLVSIRDDAIARRDAELDALQDELSDVTKNLPIDKDDLAPPSIREVVKRLKEKQK
jgi:predicted negative regulator of RcsB-dependent stress response